MFISDGLDFGLVLPDRAAASIVTPAVAGWSLWHRADLGVYTDTGATTPVASDGDPVAAWADTTGAVTPTLQATGTKQPKWYSNVQNGKPAIRFDASDDGMLTALTISASPWTVTTVYSCNQTVNGTRRTIQGRYSNWLIGPYLGYYKFYDGAAFLAGPAISVGAFVTAVVVGSGTSRSYYLNGSLVATSTSSTQPGLLAISAAGNYPEPFDGYLGELLIYPFAFDAGQLAADEAYKRSFWAHY